jgi:hypothetical protein
MFAEAGNLRYHLPLDGFAIALTATTIQLSHLQRLKYLVVLFTLYIKRIIFLSRLDRPRTFTACTFNKIFNFLEFLNELKVLGRSKLKFI